MKGGDNGNTDELRREGGKGRKLHFFEAVDNKNGNNCRGQNFADISDQWMGALFSAEKCKRKQPCQKGTNGNGQDNAGIIGIIHVAEPSFVWIKFLAARIMTMEAIKAGRIKLLGPKTRRETIPQSRPVAAGIWFLAAIH